MKKFTIGVSTLILTLLLCLTMSGCATSVAGKTYEFDDIKVQYSGEISDEAKEAFEKTKEALKETYKITYKFEDDGKYKMGGKLLGIEASIPVGTYEQDGKTLKLKPTSGVEIEFTVSGNTIQQTVTQSDDITLTIVYKQA